MRKRNTEHIGEVIRQFLKQKNLEKPLNEKKLVDAWPVILGNSIMNYTTKIYVKRKILYVSISSAVLRNDLFLTRQNIVQSLNNHVGTHVIDEIVFS